jgi:hypothetical protein
MRSRATVKNSKNLWKLFALSVLAELQVCDAMQAIAALHVLLALFLYSFGLSCAFSWSIGTSTLYLKRYSAR